MGYAPDWYFLYEVAAYMNVAPWELAKQPRVYYEWGMAKRNAEVRAQAQRKDFDSRLGATS